MIFAGTRTLTGPARPAAAGRPRSGRQASVTGRSRRPADVDGLHDQLLGDLGSRHGVSLLAAGSPEPRGDGGELLDGQRLAAGAGVDPGRGEDAAAARSAPPAQPASAARSVLRRWANAASTTAKTRSPGYVGARAARGG